MSKLSIYEQVRWRLSDLSDEELNMIVLKVNNILTQRAAAKRAKKKTQHAEDE